MAQIISEPDFRVLEGSSLPLTQGNVFEIFPREAVFQDSNSNALFSHPIEQDAILGSWSSREPASFSLDKTNAINTCVWNYIDPSGGDSPVEIVEANVLYTNLEMNSLPTQKHKRSE